MELPKLQNMRQERLSSWVINPLSHLMKSEDRLRRNNDFTEIISRFKMGINTKSPEYLKEMNQNFLHYASKTTCKGTHRPTMVKPYRSKNMGIMSSVHLSKIQENSYVKLIEWLCFPLFVAVLFTWFLAGIIALPWSGPVSYGFLASQLSYKLKMICMWSSSDGSQTEKDFILSKRHRRFSVKKNFWKVSLENKQVLPKV